jgi:hypothetical protein
MDPNEALAELRRLVATLEVADRLHSNMRKIEAMDRIGEVFTELDNWLCNGGFLPMDWHNLPTGTHEWSEETGWVKVEEE